jgi:hypothetical protein
VRSEELWGGFGNYWRDLLGVRRVSAQFVHGWPHATVTGALTQTEQTVPYNIPVGSGRRFVIAVGDHKGDLGLPQVARQAWLMVSSASTLLSPGGRISFDPREHCKKENISPSPGSVMIMRRNQIGGLGLREKGGQHLRIMLRSLSRKAAWLQRCQSKRLLWTRRRRRGKSEKCVAIMSNSPKRVFYGIRAKHGKRWFWESGRLHRIIGTLWCV